MLEEIVNPMVNILSNKLAPTIAIPYTIHLANQLAHNESQPSLSQLESKIYLSLEKQMITLMAYELISSGAGQSRLRTANKMFFQSHAQLGMLLMISFLSQIENHSI